MIADLVINVVAMALGIGCGVVLSRIKRELD